MFRYALIGSALLAVSFFAHQGRAEDASAAPALPLVSRVALQPLAAQVRNIADAMEALGTPLSKETRAALDAAGKNPDESAAIAAIQAALDPLCIAGIDINPESRVKAQAGPAAPSLIEQGWRTFLVKVHNQAGVTAELKALSPQAIQLANSPAEQIKDRWLELAAFNDRPLSPKLSGLELEYRIIQLYSRDAGKRQATLMFNVGQGTQDLGFRGELNVLFSAEPTREVTFHIKDESGKPAMACLILRDKFGHVYPSQAKRLAPDFFFQQQVYRFDGEALKLPAGAYTLQISRGPEYIPETRAITIDNGPLTIDIALKRWIDPSLFGYWSGDHHIHAAGCAHYTRPSEGVLAADMYRHIQGEDLKVGANLTWGPCFDYQKQFFTGDIDKVSGAAYLLRYDIEVSGFGSHRSGHLCLLRLKQQIYPGGESKDHWPTLGLNTLKWAKAQGAVCGPAHSGNGIANKDGLLPSYQIPDYNGIGANEFIVDITHQLPGPGGKLGPAVDFISTVDTEPRAELNMWYHALNCGYRTRASGETDFPCIYGERVGLGRSYVKLAGPLNYDAWCEGIKNGTNYVSDGYSHILNMKLGDVEMGAGDSELKMAAPGQAKLMAKVAAYLPQNAGPQRARPLQWQIEKARIGNSRNVKVEAIVNGQSVAEKIIPADGSLQELSFDLKIDRSSWVALRILYTSHSNPIFAVVADKPIRASKKSAEWCLKGVDQCWSQKKRFYAEGEMKDAMAAYEHARQAYRNIIMESEAD